MSIGEEEEVGRLILARAPGERIFIGDDVIIEVIHITENSVRFRITAPKRILINREEYRRKDG